MNRRRFASLFASVALSAILARMATGIISQFRPGFTVERMISLDVEDVYLISDRRMSLVFQKYVRFTFECGPLFDKDKAIEYGVKRLIRKRELEYPV